jgi:choline dehydrogenase-like flavoprotein
MMRMPPVESYHRMQSSSLFAIWQTLRFAWDGSGWLKSGTTTSTIFASSSHLDDETAKFKPVPGDTKLDGTRPENIPDIEIMVIPAGAIVGRYPGVPLFTLYACLVQPKTTGYIELGSLDPEADPRVHYKMMENPCDLATARKALRFTLNLTEQFMKNSGYRHPVELLYAPNAGTGRKWQDLSNEELDEFVRRAAQSVLHLGCSCRMAKEEQSGVVDDELRVYGFKNLRIADASVFPKIPNGHTMAPVYMIAERCAQFAKDTWNARA